MVTCTDCIHYNACCAWVDQNSKVVDSLNVLDSLNELYSRTLSSKAKPISRIQFPLVAETKEELCKNYEKVKVK